MLRYLAPTEPGEDRVEYSIYSAGSPSLADTATVRVTVICGGVEPRPASRDPRRARAQRQATTIPFEDFGVDPDGDAVRLDRITTQPDRGSASISADGDGIVYTSAPGDRGQVSFRYRVTDALGATGIGTVRVGVLGGEANPSPVTFTDYVYVQAGARNSVRVSPLANDIDPTGGALELTSVRPDATELLEDGTANPLYRQLRAAAGARGRRVTSRSMRARRPARCRSCTTSSANPATPGRASSSSRRCARRCPTTRWSPTRF